MINLENINLNYKDTEALKNINIEFPKIVYIYDNQKDVEGECKVKDMLRINEVLRPNLDSALAGHLIDLFRIPLYTNACVFYRMDDCSRLSIWKMTAYSFATYN